MVVRSQKIAYSATCYRTSDESSVPSIQALQKYWVLRFVGKYFYHPDGRLRVHLNLSERMGTEQLSSLFLGALSYNVFCGILSRNIYGFLLPLRVENRTWSVVRTSNSHGIQLFTQLAAPYSPFPASRYHSLKWHAITVTGFKKDVE